MRSACAPRFLFVIVNNSNVHLLDSEAFDENNRLIVNEVLQIKGYSNVYGIGDCVNTKEFKMAAHAEQHGLLIAENMIRSMKDKTLKPYKTGMCLLSLIKALFRKLCTL